MKKLILAIALWAFASVPAFAQNALNAVGPGPQPTYTAVRILGQNGLPMVDLGTTTYNNNGAIVLGTALASTPAMAVPGLVVMPQ